MDYNKSKPGNTLPKKQVNKPVVKGSVTQKKPDIFTTVGQLVMGNAKSAKERLIRDIIIPELKKLAYNAVTDTVGTLIYGENAKRQRPSGGYVDYSGRSSGGATRNSNNATAAPTARDSVAQACQCLEFDYKEDAERVLESMSNALDQFHMVSVGDLYDFADITGDPIYNSYGWTNLATANVVPSRGKWKILFPKLEPLPKR
jgi:hypothetical protein